MADAASPPCGPGRSGTRSSRGSGPALVSGLVVFALVGVVLVAVLHGVGDEAPTSGSAPLARLLAPTDAAPELPEALEGARPSLEDDEIEPLGVPPDDTLSLRRVAMVQSWWDRTLAGAKERAPLTLIVVDDQDRPVPEARVQVWGEEDEPVKSGGGERGYRIVSRAPPIGPIPYVTDAQGRCTVQPPLHTPEALVEKEGVGCSGWVDLGPGSKSRQAHELIVPLQRPAVVRGVVVQPDGRPAPGAEVALRVACAPGAPSRVPESVVADADGRFELRVDGAGSISFNIDGRGDTTWRRLELRSGGVHDIVLRQRASWRLTGRLERPPGSPDVPFAGCWVRLWPEPLAAAGEVELRGASVFHRSQADRDGRFEIEVDRPVQGLVLAQVHGWSLQDPPRVLVDAAHPEVEVTLRLCEPAWIIGRCVDAQGRPLRDARLSCSSAESLAPLARPTRAGNSELFGGTEARSTDDGSFRLGPLHPRGVYDVWMHVGAKDELRTVSRRDVAPGGSELLLALDGPQELTAGVTLLVLSGDAAGGPVTSCRFTLSARLPGGGWSRSWGQSQDDQHGLYTLRRFPPGAELCVEIESEGHGSVVLSGVQATAEGTEVKVVLPSLAGAAVTVTDDGAPAAWAIVTWTRRSEDCSGARWARETSTRADAWGRVAFSHLDPGHYRFVAVHGERSARREVDIAPGAAESLGFELR